MAKWLSLFKPAARAPSGVSPREAIEHARALHQAGSLEEAADRYARLLEAHPGDAEIHYRQANVAKDRGDLDAALAGYDRAIALKPDFAHAFCNRAVLLGLMQRASEALASYDRALEIDPTDALAHSNRGILLIGMGRQEEALASFGHAIGHRADFFPAHFHRGAILQELRRWDAALDSYDRAVAINPGDAATHQNRATVLKAIGRLDAALAGYDRAIALDDGLFRAYGGRADVLQDLNRSSEALEAYDRALNVNDQDAIVHNNRGVLLHKMARFDQAVTSYDHAIARLPHYAEAYFNRGTAQSELSDHAGACASFDEAIKLKPRYAEAYVNRGNALEGLGLTAPAIESYRQAILIDRDVPEAHYNLALAALKSGDHPTGWAEYEWRWLAKGGPIYREKREFTQPLWLGREPIAERTILLYGEQGLGDSLQFVRYVEKVAALGARVIVEVPVPLVTLCHTLRGVAQVVAYGSPLPAFDFQCPLMSLPLALSAIDTALPATMRYVGSDAAKVTAWQQRLTPNGKPLIGLTWSGNQAAGTNRKRHFPLAGLAPHLAKEYRYVCLQTDITAPDRDTLAENPGILAVGEALRDFSDTAALCECMDLVITVDTSVAHLSGALGRPTWVLLAFNADWRWLTGRDDSPWYPTMRLYRQLSPGDWNEVFERVAADLRTRFGGN